MAIAGLALALAASSVVTAPTTDRIIDVRQPSVMVEAIHEAGYKAQLKTNDKGEPFIQSAANGNDFTVEFYGCKGLADCDSFQFFSWYKKDPIFDMAFINEWNANKRFLKIVIDKDGDLSMYLDATAVGKMTYANFADLLDWYSTMDGEFTKFLADKRAAKASPAAPKAAK